MQIVALILFFLPLASLPPKGFLALKNIAKSPLAAAAVIKNKKRGGRGEGQFFVFVFGRGQNKIIKIKKKLNIC